jgi:hypothetical protein
MTRTRLQFVKKTVKLSDIKFTEGAFVSQRKVERMKAEFLGTLPVSTETEEDWIANIGFLAGLIAALTTRARYSAHNQDPTLKTAVSPQGVVELIHYASENLSFRLANPQSPKTWSLEDCLMDYVECAEFYDLQGFLDDALEMAGR